VARPVSEIIEHSVSPWMRLITPIALAMIMFILNNFNQNLNQVATDVSSVKDRIHENSRRIQANETAIEIYHHNSIKR